ncbi:hypothetical protein [Bacillus chungangensis]|uniref:Uncharacterized protein n=1 Tax=Bacillus chungangensis TaxID=587633 RepID=A0ABT9WMY3_9BACI|nr:hypothetical protein [Bacillus chungangensis]
MRYVILSFFIIFVCFSFGLNILGLLKLLPLYITSPLLFFSLFLLLAHLNNRKRFRGFH